jgi:hypothetical protein
MADSWLTQEAFDRFSTQPSYQDFLLRRKKEIEALEEAASAQQAITVTTQEESAPPPPAAELSVELPPALKNETAATAAPVQSKKGQSIGNIWSSLAERY